MDRDILAPLIAPREEPPASATPGDLFEVIKTRIAVDNLQVNDSLNDLTDRVLSGETVLLIDGFAQALAISAKGFEKRAIEEPPSQVVVRGPREGFSENLRTNTALLRQRIRNYNFTFEVMRLGKQTQTDVCLAYIKGIVNDALITEVKRRL